MRPGKAKLFLATILGFSILFAGCDFGTGSDSPDKIWIRGMTPTTGFADGDTVDFTFQIEYLLASKDSGEIDVGFNNYTSPGMDALVDSGTRFVAKGSGFDTIHARGVVKDWGTQGPFRGYANLSAHPHGTNWIPMANAYFVLIPKR